MDDKCKKILKKVTKHLDEDQEMYKKEIKEDEELKKEARTRKGRLKKGKGQREAKKLENYGKSGKSSNSSR